MKISKCIFALSLAALIIAGASRHARADQAGDTTIAIKFANQGSADSGGLTTTDIAGVTSVQTQNWNLTTGATGTFSSLVEDTSGSASTTTASIILSAPATDNQLNNTPFGDPRDFGSPPPSNPNARLVYGDLTGGDLTLTLNNLPSEFSGGFSLYIYAVGSFANETNTYTVNGNNATAQTSTADESGAWVANHGYVLFTDLSGTSLTISNVDTVIGGRTTIDGIELVANSSESESVPEPSTYGMLLGGALVLGCLTRRRAKCIRAA